ncbi:MAG: hypothetical protein JXA42_10685 [Anaerolineales bacterium]|nr:hypothetical protein [Anaerolineales bacterium]
MEKENKTENNSDSLEFTGAGGTFYAPSSSDKTFDRARNKAFIQDLLSFLRINSTDLLPFETVRQRLGLGEKKYLGIQSIPLDQIVGSVGRYNDFTRTFLPRTEVIRDRWKKLDQGKTIRGMAPIQVYQVGLVYFVIDGNKRVSVARQAGVDAIQGHVWEFETRVPLEPDDSIQDVLIRKEYLEFLERTQLDQHRPDIYIILTMPGRYRDLEEHIAIHRHYLELEQDRDISFQQAAVHWYDHVYRPIIDLIHQEDMLRRFPGRTEGDLVCWIIRNRFSLRQQYGASDLLSETLVKEATSRLRQNSWQRFVSWFRRKALRWPVYTGEPWQPKSRHRK